MISASTTVLYSLGIEQRWCAPRCLSGAVQIKDYNIVVLVFVYITSPFVDLYSLTLASAFQAASYFYS